MTGGEYVVPSIRALFRIPYSIIKLQASSASIETGWTVEHNAAMEVGPWPLPECTDGRVTETRTTTAGTVAHHHVTDREGPDAFDAREVDQGYTDETWRAVVFPSF